MKSISDKAVQLARSINLTPDHKALSNKYLSIEFSEKSLQKELTDKPFHVCIDGYINNIEQLKKLFSVSGKNQEEVIENILLSGEKNIERYLLGSYSIIIFNSKKLELDFFTDFIGSKPIYYYSDSSLCAVGSEIKFLKCISDINFKPNKRRIIQYLCQYKESQKDTFYENIFLAEPSTKYHYSIKGFERNKYSHHKNYDSKAKNFEEAKFELKAALLNAIEQNKKIFKSKSGVLLSGGLDSACIYKLLYDSMKNNNIHTFSYNFYGEDGKPLVCDESFYQNILIEDPDNHHSVKFTKQSPFNNIKYWLMRNDEPITVANIYLIDEVMKEAKANDVSVIYNGIDGDTVVSHGWERFKELFKLSSLPIFFYELWNFSKKHNYSEYTRTSLFRLFLIPLLRNNFLFSPFFKIKERFKKKNIPNNNIVEEHILKKYKYSNDYDFGRNFRSHKDKIDNFAISTGLINLNILLFEYGIHQISPFFDKTVIDLCLSFPSSYKLRHGSSRHILREAFKDTLPNEIIDRYSKANLTESFSNTISKDDFKKIRYEIDNMHPYLHEIINKEKIEMHFTKISKKTLNNKTIMSIWSFYLTNLWLKQNF